MSFGLCGSNLTYFGILVIRTSQDVFKNPLTSVLKKIKRHS